MLAGKISTLKYFPNCFWDIVGEEEERAGMLVLIVSKYKIVR
jgi:hypothetical protein